MSAASQLACRLTSIQPLPGRSCSAAPPGTHTRVLLREKGPLQGKTLHAHRASVLHRRHYSRLHRLRFSTMGSEPAESSASIRVILGSSSKWRAQLVGRAIPQGFILVPGGMAPDIDEKALGDRSDGADAKELVSTIAHAKADALIPLLRASDPPKADLVITADQVIVFNGTVREKPVDEQQALEYMQSYGQTGHPAECVTGVVVSCVASGERFSGVDVAWQHFHPVPDDVAKAVVAKGEVMHCAGSFMVDEPMLHPFLAERKGEVESVEGMPISLTESLLLKAAASMNS